MFLYSKVAVKYDLRHTKTTLLKCLSSSAQDNAIGNLKLRSLHSQQTAEMLYAGLF